MSDRKIKNRIQLAEALKQGKLSPVDLVVVKELEENTDTLKEVLKELKTEKKMSVDGVNKVEIKGDKGDKGDEPSDDRLLSLIEPLIPEPIKGDKGDNYILTKKDKKEIAEQIEVPIVEKVIEKTVETIIEKPIVTEKIIEKAVADTPEVIVQKVNSLKGKIKTTAIEGLSDLERIVKHNAESVGVTTTHFLKNGSTLGRAKNINFIEGNNISLSVSLVGDIAHVTVTSTASGGGGSTVPISYSGSVNGVNASFNFVSAPNILYIDHVPYQQTSSDGTVNWTGTTSITITGAPVPVSDLFGI